MCSTSTGTRLRAPHRAAATRRSLLAGGLAAAGGALAPWAALAHTPYRQWKVYRQRHLVIGATREDPASYPLAKEIEAFLAAEVPESSPRVARARTRRRLADLLATDQLPAVLVSTEDARALAAGVPPFNRPVDIRVLRRFDDHVLVVRPSFLVEHARRLARAFDEHGVASPIQPESEADLPAPLHAGARIAHEGGRAGDPGDAGLDGGRRGEAEPFRRHDGGPERLQRHGRGGPGDLSRHGHGEPVRLPQHHHEEFRPGISDHFHGTRRDGRAPSHSHGDGLSVDDHMHSDDGTPIARHLHGDDGHPLPPHFHDGGAWPADIQLDEPAPALPPASEPEPAPAAPEPAPPPARAAPGPAPAPLDMRPPRDAGLPPVADGPVVHDHIHYHNVEGLHSNHRHEHRHEPGKRSDHDHSHEGQPLGGFPISQDSAPAAQDGAPAAGQDDADPQ